MALFSNIQKSLFPESRKVDALDTVEKYKPTEWGISHGQKDTRIAKTPEEKRKDPLINLEPPKEQTDGIKLEANRLLMDTLEAAKPGPDNFDFEKTMTAYYKMMVALIENDMVTLQQESELIRMELEKMDEKRAKEFDNIMSRAEWNKILEYIGIAGSTVGGVASAIALGAGTGGFGILAATAVLTAISVNKAAGDPIGHFAFGDDMPDWYKDVETVASLAATVTSVVLSGGVSLVGGNAAAIAMAAPLVTSIISGGGGAYIKLDDTKGKASLKEIEFEGEKAEMAQESLTENLREHSARLSSLMRDVKALQQPKVF